MYSLIAATLILSLMMLKVCTNVGSRKQPRQLRNGSSTQCSFNKPQTATNRGAFIPHIRNQIEVHKAEIQKLEELLKQAE
jgi:hypothetical protein